MITHLRRFLAILTLVVSAADAAGSVVVNGIDLDAPGDIVLPKELQATARSGSLKWIVRLREPVREEQKRSLTSLGARLEDYLPDFAFVATMSDTARKKVARLPFVTAVVRFHPAYKLAQKLREAASTDRKNKVKVVLRLDRPQSLTLLLPFLKAKGEVLQAQGDLVTVAAPASRVAELAEPEEVLWVDEDQEMHILNDTSRWVVQSGREGDTAIWAKGLRGEGQLVGLGDTGIDYDMPWFRDDAAPIGPAHRKIVAYDTTYGDDYDADFPGHGTHVAATLAGDRTPLDGSTAGNGIAPKARIFLQDIAPGSGSGVYPPADLGLLFATAYDGGARLHSDSWGNGSNAYGPPAASVDRYVWEHPDFLPLFANGNTGPGRNTAGNPATAKNVVSVGAGGNGAAADEVADFSSNGPTADGRLKPTVIAPGIGIVSADSDGLKASFNSGTLAMSGTSMATPAVSGAAALVRQYFTEGFHPSGRAGAADAFTPSAALVKALLVNSAQQMAGSGSGGPIPSMAQGWGRVNLSRALRFDDQDPFLEVADVTQGIGTGDSWSREMLVRGERPLKVTLVWNDYPGATGASIALVNDLDLAVTSPTGTTYAGNVFSGGVSVPAGSADRLNVEEQVLLESPPAGTYRVTVSGYNVPFGPQPFAVVITGGTGVSQRGTVSLDRRHYRTGSTARITVSDSGLNGDDGTAENASVTVSSGSDPVGKTVMLLETAPASGIFSGSVILSGLPAEGRLQVRDGDTVTVAYRDADDGTGHPATVIATAVADDTPPAVSAVSAQAVIDTAAVIVWKTDEPSTAVLAYGEKDLAAMTLSETRLTTEHRMTLAALREAVKYSVTITATDEAGNAAVAPAFTFTTASLPPLLTVAAAEGETTYRDSATISGTARDPSGIAALSVNGSAVPWDDDGSYWEEVPLEVGDNIIAVTAADTLGNRAEEEITVTRLLPADLTVRDVSGPAKAQQGETVEVSAKVCNAGPGATPPFQTGFYLSADGALSGDDTLLGTRGVPSLAVGSCSTVTLAAAVPQDAPGGLLHLLAAADIARVVAETDETNNCGVGPTIELPPPAVTAPSFLALPASSASDTVFAAWGISATGGSSYVLEYSRDGGPFLAAYSGADTWATVTLPGNGAYVFRVKATGAGRESGYATAACTVRLACGAPSFITATPQGSAVFVAWGKSDTGGVSYVLEYAADDGTYGAAYRGTSLYATVPVTGSGTYVFRVKATREDHDESAATAASCTVRLACALPAPITVAPAGGASFVSWGKTDVPGATYLLECSRKGRPFVTAYKGKRTYTTVRGGAGCSFRVRATRKGYSPSEWQARLAGSSAP